MPKIKNWSRSGKYSRGGGAFEAGWNHDNSSVRLFVMKSRSGNRPYSVQIRSDNQGRRTLKRNRKNFEEAREWAVKWMKANPNISEDDLTAVQIGNKP